MISAKPDFPPRGPAAIPPMPRPGALECNRYRALTAAGCPAVSATGRIISRHPRNVVQVRTLPTLHFAAYAGFPPVVLRAFAPELLGEQKAYQRTLAMVKTVRPDVPNPVSMLITMLVLVEPLPDVEWDVDVTSPAYARFRAGDFNFRAAARRTISSFRGNAALMTAFETELVPRFDDLKCHFFDPAANRHVAVLDRDATVADVGVSEWVTFPVAFNERGAKAVAFSGKVGPCSVRRGARGRRRSGCRLSTSWASPSSTSRCCRRRCRGIGR